MNIATIYTTVFVPEDLYNSLTLWYGNIFDFHPKKGFLPK